MRGRAAGHRSAAKLLQNASCHLWRGERPPSWPRLSSRRAPLDSNGRCGGLPDGAPGRDELYRRIAADVRETIVELGREGNGAGDSPPG